MAASLVAAFILPAAAGAQSDRGGTASRLGAGTFDLILLRPLQVAATAIGCALFVPAAVFTSPGGRDSVAQAWDIFVATPGEAAFRRRIGDF